MIRRTLALLFFLALTTSVRTETLDFESVKAPDVNCALLLKSPGNCSITVSDSSSRFFSDKGFLQSRTFQITYKKTGNDITSVSSTSATPTNVSNPTGQETYYFYLYRIDLTQVTENKCVKSFSIYTGKPEKFVYKYNNKYTKKFGFIINGGGALGSVGLLNNPEFNNDTGEMTFQFGNGVCQKKSSYFFGFASKQIPIAATARIIGSNPDLELAARSPSPFTHVPVNISQINDNNNSDANLSTGIISLGNLGPGGGHVLPVNHLYLAYPNEKQLETPEEKSTGASVFAMGKGKIFLILAKVRSEHDIDSSTGKLSICKPGTPCEYIDYQVYIQHTNSIVSYYDHLHTLADAIKPAGMSLKDALLECNYYDPAKAPSGKCYLKNLGTVKKQVDGKVITIETWVFPLEKGNMASIPLDVNAVLGYVKKPANSSDWDVGVIDKNFTSGTFSDSFYPGLNDLTQIANTLPGMEKFFPSYTYMGNQQKNANGFLAYFSDENPLSDGSLKKEWLSLLPPKSHGLGQTGWDKKERLQGVWFTENLPDWDTTDISKNSIYFNIDMAALTIVPDNLDPDNTVQIGFGNADQKYLSSFDSSAANEPGNLNYLAALDPYNFGKDKAVTQIQMPFKIPVKKSVQNSTVKYDPAPSEVSIGDNVCYALPYQLPGDQKDYYDYLLIHVEDYKKIRVKYLPTHDANQSCPTKNEDYTTGGFVYNRKWK